MNAADPAAEGTTVTAALPRVSSAGGIADVPPTLANRPRRSESPDSDAGMPRVRGYDILGVIGTGGMGVVYKARHRDLRRVVALKTIRAAIDDPTARARFHSEAAAAAGLQHPNIVQVFEIGTVEARHDDAPPCPFMALELVEGGSLAARTKKPWPPRDAARLVEKLARAAHAAHVAGVIHRDLKPANVLLTRDGEPKVADFGIAKQIGFERGGGDLPATEAGTVVGTPEYMSPEQAAGVPPTPAFDVYAIGVILYELLTGRVPFQGACMVETFTLLRHQEPVPPRSLQPRVPRDLETICLKCLEKDPARRYASADALADDLARTLGDRPILARRTSDAEKVLRWCRRNPTAAASLASVVATFLLAFALVSWSYLRAEAARQDEAEQRREAHRNAESERWERYRATIVAVPNVSLRSNVNNTRWMLEQTPKVFRNWEYWHYESRLDLARHTLHSDLGESVVCDLTASGRHAVLYGRSGPQVWDTQRRRLLREFPGGDRGWSGESVDPAGRAVFRYGDDGSVAVYDIETGPPVVTLLGHRVRARFARTTDDGKRVVTMSAETIRLWDLQTGRLLRRLRQPDEGPSWFEVRRDGRRLAFWGVNKPRIRLFDLDAGTECAVIDRTASGPGFGLARFGNATDRLLTAEVFPSNVLHLYDRDGGRLLAELRGHANTITDAAFAPDDSAVATCSTDQTVRLWDGVTGKPRGTLKGHLGGVCKVAFSPDGRRLVSASLDQSVRLWDVETGEPLAVLTGHTGAVRSACFTPDGRTIVSAGHDGTVRFWDAGAAEREGVFRGHGSFVYGVAFHPDGERVASASWDGTARVWRASTGEQLLALRHGDKALVTSVAFDPAGKRLATRTRGGVVLWDAESGREVRRWDAPVDGFLDSRVAFCPRGGLLASGCAGGEVRVWDVARPDPVAVFRFPNAAVRDVTFSPDGRYLVAAANHHPVRVWDIAERREVTTLDVGEHGAYAVAFDREGATLAVGSEDGTACLLDVRSWERLAVLRHGGGVYGVAFTPDGTRLACACADNSVRLWDTRRHQEVVELRGHQAYVHQVAFSPDGTRLLSGSGDHTVRIWDTLSPRERSRRGGR